MDRENAEVFAPETQVHIVEEATQSCGAKRGRDEDDDAPEPDPTPDCVGGGQGHYIVGNADTTDEWVQLGLPPNDPDRDFDVTDLEVRQIIVERDMYVRSARTSRAVSMVPAEAGGDTIVDAAADDEAYWQEGGSD